MSRSKIERLLNLTMCLMATPRYLSVGEIGDLVEGYGRAGGDEREGAFRRMFERDKDELRELGVPLETGSSSGWDDEVGYRISRRDYALPDLHLTPEEASALGLAARLWSSASLAAASASGLRKLQAAGLVIRPAPAGLEPRVDATEPALEPALAAVREGRVVHFDYRRPADSEPAPRKVEPWGVVSWRGRWYLVGHDRAREATRVFRLSRVAGPLVPVGPPGAVVVPPGVDLRAAVEAANPVGPQQSAAVRLRTGAAHGLRRELFRTGAQQEAPDEPGNEWERWAVSFHDVERLADRIVAVGPDASVVAPAELAEAVHRRLRAALLVHTGEGLPVPAVLPEPPEPPEPPAPPPAANENASPTVPTVPSGAGPRRPRTPGTGTTSSERLPRLLALVPYLRTHPDVALQELAEVFSVPVRQIRQDLELLWVCGLPGGAPGDLLDLSFSGDRVTLLDPQTLDCPLRLTADEALALVVAARTLADVPGLAEREALDRALVKLETAFGAGGPPGAGAPVVGGSSTTLPVQVALEAEAAVLAPLQHALDAKRRVHLRYLVESRDELTERDVDPMRLLSSEGRWYLEGWCHRAEGVRLFRLDRIDAVDTLEVPAAPPPQARSRDLAEGLFQPSEGDLEVLLELGPAARWVADYYPVSPAQTGIALPGSVGGPRDAVIAHPTEARDDVTQVRVSLRTPDWGWVVGLVLRLGGAGRVLGPPELRRRVADTAERALASPDA